MSARAKGIRLALIWMGVSLATAGAVATLVPDWQLALLFWVLAYACKFAECKILDHALKQRTAP